MSTRGSICSPGTATSLGIQRSNIHDSITGIPEGPMISRLKARYLKGKSEKRGINPGNGKNCPRAKRLHYGPDEIRITANHMIECLCDGNCQQTKDRAGNRTRELFHRPIKLGPRCFHCSYTQRDSWTGP